MSKSFSSINRLPFSIGPPPGLEPAYLAVPLLDAELDVGFDVAAREIDQQRTWSKEDLDLTSPNDHWLAAVSPRCRTRTKKGPPRHDCQSPSTDVPNSTAPDTSIKATWACLSTAPDARTCLPASSCPLGATEHGATSSKAESTKIGRLQLRLPVSSAVVNTPTGSNTPVENSPSSIAKSEQTPCVASQTRIPKMGFEVIHESACRARARWMVSLLKKGTVPRPIDTVPQYPQRRFVDTTVNAQEQGEWYAGPWPNHQQRSCRTRNSFIGWRPDIGLGFEGQSAMRVGGTGMRM